LEKRRGPLKAKLYNTYSLISLVSWAIELGIKIPWDVVIVVNISWWGTVQLKYLICGKSFGLYHEDT